MELIDDTNQPLINIYLVLSFESSIFIFREEKKSSEFLFWFSLIKLTNLDY